MMKAQNHPIPNVTSQRSNFQSRIANLLSLIYKKLQYKQEIIIYVDRTMQTPASGIRQSMMTNFKRSLDNALSALGDANEHLTCFVGTFDDHPHLVECFEDIKQMDIGMLNCVKHLLEVDLDLNIDFLQGAVAADTRHRSETRTDSTIDSARQHLNHFSRDVEDHLEIANFVMKLEDVRTCLRVCQSLLIQLEFDRNRTSFHGIVGERDAANKKCRLLVRRTVYGTADDDRPSFAQNLATSIEKVHAIAARVQKLSLSD